MAYDQSPRRGSVYWLDSDGSVEVVMTDVTISNGSSGAPTAASPTTPTPLLARSRA